MACLHKDLDKEDCPHGFLKLESSFTDSHGNEKDLCDPDEFCCLMHPEFDAKVIKRREDE